MYDGRRFALLLRYERDSVKDTVTVAILIVAFAWIVTMHVAIAFGLALRSPRWRALVAFVLVIPGLVWAWRERMRARVCLWIAGAIVYLGALLFASRG